MHAFEGMSDDSDESDYSRSNTYESSFENIDQRYAPEYRRYAPETHRRFRGMQCWWCDRLTFPKIYFPNRALAALPPCALCERENFDGVLKKSIALLTMKKWLQSRLPEELADSMAVAIFISLCGSYSGTTEPLARIYHV